MKKGWAIFCSLFLAAAGPLALGHRKQALIALFSDALAFAGFLAGALWGSAALLYGGLALFGVIRIAMLVVTARLSPGPDAPSASKALLLIFAIMALDYSLTFAAKRDLVEAFKIPAGSMIPTLQVGDHIYVDKRKTTPQRGDVIVFRYPPEPDKDFIKRVIAVGGDTVEWQDESPVVNGKPLARAPADGECGYTDFDDASGTWETRRCRAFDETIDGRPWRVIQDPNPNLAPRASFTVPPNSYYVLGDNRDNSHDSRYWGAVPADHVKGTAVWIWLSSGKDGFRNERIGLRVR